jgi:hypothetical protein
MKYVGSWGSSKQVHLRKERSRFHSRRYQIFCEVVVMERGPLILVSITELPGRKSSCSGLENRDYGCRDPRRWPLDTLYPEKLAITSSTSGGHSGGIVRSRTQPTQFVCIQSVKFNRPWIQMNVLLCHNLVYVQVDAWYLFTSMGEKKKRYWPRYLLTARHRIESIYVYRVQNISNC